MADEIIQLGADFSQAVRALSQLDRAMRDVSNSGLRLGKVITNLSFDLEGGEIQAKNFAHTFETIDAAGNKAKITLQELDGEILGGNATIVSAGRNWQQLRNDVETSLSQSLVQIKKFRDAGKDLTPEKAFVPELKGADYTAAQKFSSEYGRLLETIGRIGPQQKELNEVTEAYFKQKPTVFIGSQREIFDALVRTGKAAEKVNQQVSEFQQIVLSEKSAKRIAPLVPLVEQRLPTLPADITDDQKKHAQDALTGIKQFLADNSSFTKREIERTFTSIEKGNIDKIKAIKQEFAALYFAAVETYQGIAAASAASAARQVAELQKVGTALQIKDLNKTLLSSVDDSINQLKGKFNNLVLTIPKPRSELPTEGVSPRLFQTQEAAFIKLQEFLNRTKFEATDVTAALIALGENSSRALKDPAQLGLYKALRDVLDAENAIELQAAKSTEAIKKSEAERVAAAQRSAQALAGLAARQEATNATRVVARERVTFPIAPRAEEFQPNLVEAVRQNVLNLDNTIIKTKADVSTLNAAFAAIHITPEELTLLPPDVAQVRAALLGVFNSYDRLDAKVAESVVKEDALNKKRSDSERLAAEKIIQSNKDIELAKTKVANIDVTHKAISQVLPTFAPSVPLDDEFTRKIALATSKIKDQIDGVTVGYDQWLRAYQAATNPSLLEGLNAEERKLSENIRQTIDLYQQFGSVIDKAKAKEQEAATKQTRFTEVKDVLSTRLAGVPTTGVDENKLFALEKAQRAVVTAFVDGDVELKKFDELLSIAGSNNRLTAIEPEFHSIYETITRLVTAVRALDAELSKTGEATVRSARVDVVKQFRDSKITVDQFKVALENVGKGAPALNDIQSKLESLKKTVLDTGGSWTEEAKQVEAAINQEITKIAEREQAEIDSAAKRKARQAADKVQRDAANAARNEDLTREAQARRPFVEQAFRQPQVTIPGEEPIPTGLTKERAIPSFAKQSDIIGINAGFSAITQSAIKAGVSVNDLIRLIASVRTELSKPVSQQAWSELSPQLNKLRQEIISTETAFKSIEHPATSAGKGILISWQGIIRLFEAQVIHTFLAQIIADFRQAVFAVGDFEREIALIQTITQDQATSFNQWSGAILNVANALGRSPTEVATAAYEALSNQVASTLEETIKFTETATQLARTTGSTVPDAVNLLSSAINSYGFNVNDSEQIAAKFFATIDVGRVKVGEIANTFGRVTALGKELGVGFDEINAGLAALTRGGIRASDAQTQLNNIFIKLIRPTTELKAYFKELGVTSGEELVRVRGLGGTLQLLAQAAQAGKIEISEVFNELRGARGYYSLAADGAKIYGDAFRQVTEGVGERFARAKEIIGKPAGVEFQRQLQEIKNIITDDLGRSVAEFAVNFSKNFGGFPNLFRNITAAISATSGTLVAFGVTALATYTILKTYAIATTVFNILQTILTSVIFTFRNLGTVASSAWALIAAHPFIAIVAGVAAAVTAIKIYFNLSEEAALRSYNNIQEQAKKSLDEIDKAYAVSSQAETKVIQDGLKEQATAFQKWNNEVSQYLNRLADSYKDTFDTIKRNIEVSFSGTVDILKDGVSQLKKESSDASRDVETIHKFQRDTAEKTSQRVFERDVKAFPEQKIPLTDLRTADLSLRAQKLLDLNNIQEGLKLLGDVEKLQNDIADIPTRRKQIDENERRLRELDVITSQQRVIPNNQKILRASERYQAIAAKTPETDQQAQSLRDQRAAALVALNVAELKAVTPHQSIRETASLEQKRALIQRQLKAGGISEAEAVSRVAIIQAEINKLLDGTIERRAKDAQNAANTTRVLEDNLKELQLLQKEAAQVKFTDAKGAFLPESDIKKARKTLDELQARIIAQTQNIADIEFKAGVKVDYQQLLSRIAQIKDQFTALTRNVDAQFNLDNTVKELKHAGDEWQAYLEKVQKSVTGLEKENERLNHLKFDALGSGGQANVQRTRDILADKLEPGMLSNIPFLGKTYPLSSPTAALGGSQEIESRLNIVATFDEFQKAYASLNTSSTTEQLDQVNAKFVELDQTINQHIQKYPKAAEQFRQPDFKFRIDGKDEPIAFIDIVNNLRQRLLDLHAAFKLNEREDQLHIMRGVATTGQIPSPEDIKKLAPDLQEGLIKQQQLIRKTNEVAPPELRKHFAPIPLPNIPGDFKDQYTKQLEQEIKVAPKTNIIVDPLKTTITISEDLRRQLEREIRDAIEADPKQYKAVIPGVRIVPNNNNNIPTEIKKPVINPEDAILFNAPNVPNLKPTNQGLNETSQNFNTFSTNAIDTIELLINRINNGLAPALANVRGQLNLPQPQAKTAATGGLYFASGGMVPVMTTPGEIFIPPQITKLFLPQLIQMNKGLTPRFYQQGGFVPKGTDTQPAMVPSGTFILNKYASDKVRYYQFGGTDIHSGFTGFSTNIIQQYDIDARTFNKNVRNDVNQILNELIGQSRILNSSLLLSEQYTGTTGKQALNASFTIAHSTQGLQQIESSLGNTQHSIQAATFTMNAAANNLHENIKPTYHQYGGFIPRGTDTVPGYVPSGTFIVNKSSSERFSSILKSMAGYYQDGGVVNNKHQFDKNYYQSGGLINYHDKLSNYFQSSGLIHHKLTNSKYLQDNRVTNNYFQSVGLTNDHKLINNNYSQSGELTNGHKLINNNNYFENGGLTNNRLTSYFQDGGLIDNRLINNRLTSYFQDGGLIDNNSYFQGGGELINNKLINNKLINSKINYFQDGGLVGNELTNNRLVNNNHFQSGGLITNRLINHFQENELINENYFQSGGLANKLIDSTNNYFHSGGLTNNRLVDNRLVNNNHFQDGGLVNYFQDGGLVNDSLVNKMYYTSKQYKDFGNKATEYFQYGGISADNGFVPQLNTHNTIYNPSMTKNDSQENLNIGDIHINMQGGNINTEQQAMALSKALQRQIRIKRLKG